jgi:large subunit ribosomal protein L14
MLFAGSKIKVSDNSGVTLVRCIKVPGSSKPRFARTGDVIVVSARFVKPKHHLKESKRLHKGDVLKAIVTRTIKPVFFADNGFVRFLDNSAVVVKKAQPRTFGGPKLAGNRVFGPIVANKALKKRFPKLFSLSSRVLK